jgi:hypothetical protein
MFVRTVVPVILGIGQMDAMTVDSDGDVFVASTGLGRVWMLGSAATEMVLRRSGASADSGDGGPATQAGLTYPNASASMASAGCTSAAYRIRRADAGGTISTIAGSEQPESLTRRHAGGGRLPLPSRRPDRGPQR